jgi:hypothetical protein
LISIAKQEELAMYDLEYDFDMNEEEHIFAICRGIVNGDPEAKRAARQLPKEGWDALYFVMGEFEGRDLEEFDI